MKASGDINLLENKRLTKIYK